MATTFNPLIEAIEEVLVQGAGSARTLAAADRFLLNTTPEMPADHQAFMGHQEKRVWVAITGLTPDQHFSENSGNAHYNITITLHLSYYTDAEMDHEAIRDTLIKMANDAHKVRAALGQAGNLTQNLAAQDTGLVSGLLFFQSYDPGNPDVDNKLFPATITFDGDVILANPA